SGIPTYFVLQIPRRLAGSGLDRPTQLRAIRGKFIGNPRISLATLQRSTRAQSAARLEQQAPRRGGGFDGNENFAKSRLHGGGDLLTQAYHLAREQVSCKNKARLVRPGSSSAPKRRLLRRGDFPELALERLVGLPGEVGIKLAELGRFRHKALIRALGVVGLHLDRLFERLRADEFLGRG